MPSQRARVRPGATSLSGPAISPFNTYSNQTLLDCNGNFVLSNFYGVAAGGQYIVLDQNQQQIKQAGLPFDEQLAIVDSSQNNKDILQGSGATDANFHLIDFYASGAQYQPLPSYAYVYVQQTITYHPTGSTVTDRPITDHPRRYRKTGERKVPLRKNSRSWTRVIDKELRAEEMTWAEQDRFAERTMVERVFSRLKDEFGFRSLRVRGASKVMAHLMFGVLALTVDQLLKLSG